VSSAFYFEKAAVAATGMASAASRTALFAAINGASAAIIGIVQVSMTCTSLSDQHWKQCSGSLNHINVTLGSMEP
jgi:hypothetical protein